MNTNYPVGEFLISLKNASMAKNKHVTILANKQIVAIAEELKKLGFLDGVKKVEDPERSRRNEGMLECSLAFRFKKPVLLGLKLVSKPGLRIYMGIDEIEKKKGPSTYLISSPKGIISTKEAVKNRMGGEVIAEIL
jgi:small subunit ribosomal protein S8